MTWHPFKWEPNVAPEPDQISPITKRAIKYRHAWQMNAAIAERSALSRLGKAWRTRKGGAHG